MRDSDVSFVVQGPIYTDGGTAKVLASIRLWYPHAHVIVSTFNDSSREYLDSLDADEIVVSDDPGDITPSNAKALNINRQIVSTRAGIARVKTPYVIKTRTDLVLNSKTLLDIYAPYEGRDVILVTNITTRDPDLAVRIPYWICDFLYLGRTDDIKFIFDAPLYSDSDFSYFVESGARSVYCPDVVSIFPPEVYLGLRIRSLFYPNRRKPINLTEVERMSRKEFWEFCADHLLIVDSYDIALSSIKYKLPFMNNLVMISSGKWRAVSAFRASRFETAGIMLVRWFSWLSYFIRRCLQVVLNKV